MTTPDIDLDALEAAALAATPQDFDSAEIVQKNGGDIECPACGGEGYVTLYADYCSYDSKALGVQFYGIGTEHGAAEAYYRASRPAVVLELIRRLRAAEEWMPIETAPECMCVVVGWHETEDGEHSERYDFDMKDEDGCWLNHEDSYQHFCAVAPPGSTGPKEIAPYTHWHKVPPVPRHRVASPATQLAAEGATK